MRLLSFKLKTQTGYIDPSDITRLYVETNNPAQLQIRSKSTTAAINWDFETAQECTKAVETLTKAMSKQESKNMIKDLITDLRSYITDNREIVYAIVLVMLVDQFVFEGAFRERLKALVEGFLKKAEAKASGSIIDTTAVKVE